MCVCSHLVRFNWWLQTSFSYDPHPESNQHFTSADFLRRFQTRMIMIAFFNLQKLLQIRLMRRNFFLELFLSSSSDDLYLTTNMERLKGTNNLNFHMINIICKKKKEKKNRNKGWRDTHQDLELVCNAWSNTSRPRKSLRTGEAIKPSSTIIIGRASIKQLNLQTGQNQSIYNSNKIK